MGQDFGGYSNVNDIFSAFSDIFSSGMFGGGFDDMFGGGSSRRGGGGRRNIDERGSDLKIRLPLTLEEIAKGADKTLKIKKWVKCDECDGKVLRVVIHSLAAIPVMVLGEIRQVSRVALCSGNSLIYPLALLVMVADR